MDFNLDSILPISNLRGVSGAGGWGFGLVYFVCFCILPTSSFSTWCCLLEQCHAILAHCEDTSSQERQTWGHSGVHWWVFPGAKLSTEPSLKLPFPMIKTVKILAHRKTQHISIMQSVSSLLEKTALFTV